MNEKITKARRLHGKPRIPGDKSVSHRSLMFGALAEGVTEVSHLLESADVLSTWACLERLGVPIRRQGDRILVEGRGMQGFRKPKEILDCGNSGTTIRLLMGILSGQPLECVLTGDASLRKRPMKRIAAPLGEMGALIELTDGDKAPVKLQGAARLKPLRYALPVASAQLKSALLLAGLFAEGTTTLTGLIRSRDHTERLLPHFGVSVEASAEAVSIRGGQKLRAAQVNVPSDISTAAFWMAAAALVPDSTIEMENISLNPSRVGILRVLERMGAGLQAELTEAEPEPVGRISVRSGELRGTRVLPDEVPSLIDEIPLIAVLATAAQGETEVSGAEELRVKESDRIEAVAANLRAMGGEIETWRDGFVIRGPQRLHGARIDPRDDHRIAMAFSIAGLIADGETEIEGAECVAVSYPDFYRHLRELVQG